MTAPRAIALVLASLLCGAFIALIGVLMGAAGHGWTGASVAATALITAPAAAVALITRKRGLAIAVTALNVAADLALIALTIRDGLADAASTFEHAAPLLIGWAVVWVGWQILPILGLRRTS